MRCRIREIMKLTALLVLIFPVLQCNHPFEEGMTGSFPVFELESSQYITLPASGTSSELKGTIKVRTNSGVTAVVRYEGSGATSWIHSIRVDMDYENTEAVITFSASKNTQKRQRTAQIVIQSDVINSDITVNVTQEPGTSSGPDDDPDEENIYYGDLILRTQNDILACEYTRVEGRLIIGNLSEYGGYMSSYLDTSLSFESSDIYDVNNLSSIEFATDIIMVSNWNLYDVSALSGIETNSVEFSDMPASAFQSYSGPAYQVAVVGNSGYMSDLYCVSTMGNLQYLILKGNDTGSINYLTEARGLLNLEISDDASLRNVNLIADMPALEYVTLSGLNVSEAQLNYIREVRPDLSVSGYDLLAYVSPEIYVADESLSMNSAVFTMTVYDQTGISIQEDGFILSEYGNDFDFSSRQITGFNQTNTTNTYNVDYLVSDVEYNVWMYVIDENGSIHLSPRCTFRTKAEELYSFNVTPSYPQYDNTQGYEPADMLAARVFVDNADGTVSSEYHDMTENAGTWSFMAGPGYKRVFFSNIPESASSAIVAFSESEGDVRWHVTQSGDAGLGQDIQIAAYETDFYDNLDFSASLSRPVLRFGVKFTVNGNLPVENIQDVAMYINNCYGSCMISGQTGTITYDGNVTNVVHGSQWSDRTVYFDDTYIFPNVEGAESRLDFVFTLTDGSQISAYYIMDNALTANNDYTGENSLSLTITWRFNGVNFTVDSIEEEINDVIEF